MGEDADYVRCKRRIRGKNWLEQMSQKGAESKKWEEGEHFGASS